MPGAEAPEQALDDLSVEGPSETLGSAALPQGLSLHGHIEAQGALRFAASCHLAATYPQPAATVAAPRVLELAFERCANARDLLLLDDERIVVGHRMQRVAAQHPPPRIEHVGAQAVTDGDARDEIVLGIEEGEEVDVGGVDRADHVDARLGIEAFHAGARETDR